MSQYFDYFDGAVYINLESRPERRQVFEQRANEIGLCIPRFQAVTFSREDPLMTDEMKKDPRSHFKVGCNLSHAAVVRMAKERGWKNVLIFEDDCVFLPGFVEKMKRCVTDLQTVQWDLFYMGGEPNIKQLPLTDHLVLCPPNGGIYLTHAYAVNQSFYDRILWFNPYKTSAIDVMYLHAANRRYVLAKELLAIQDAVESDLWGVIMDRSATSKLVYNLYVSSV